MPVDRFISREEIRVESAEITSLAGATDRVVEIVLPAGADGTVTGFGQDFGAAGAFGPTILWSIEVNGAGADQWTRFDLQRGTFTEPVNPEIYIPPGGRVAVVTRNATGGVINPRAVLRVNVRTTRGIRASDFYEQRGSGEGGGSQPPAGGGGWRPPPPGDDEGRDGTGEGRINE